MDRPWGTLREQEKNKFQNWKSCSSNLFLTAVNELCAWMMLSSETMWNYINQDY